ncbi:hypothetical protein BHM03_00030563 [Ensete ventricosum]|nr:hypothetical protein BHM03_00030563 [Ensete ventricosum]
MMAGVGERHRLNPYFDALLHLVGVFFCVPRCAHGYYQINCVLLRSMQVGFVPGLLIFQSTRGESPATVFTCMSENPGRSATVRSSNGNSSLSSRHALNSSKFKLISVDLPGCRTRTRHSAAAAWLLIAFFPCFATSVFSSNSAQPSSPSASTPRSEIAVADMVRSICLWSRRMIWQRLEY